MSSWLIIWKDNKNSGAVLELCYRLARDASLFLAYSPCFNSFLLIYVLSGPQVTSQNNLLDPTTFGCQGNESIVHQYSRRGKNSTGKGIVRGGNHSGE